MLQNDSVVDITTQCQSVVDASAKSDSFTVKAVNEYGSLGPSSTAQDGTSGSNTLADDNHRPDMVAIGGNGYIEILVQSPLPVSIHNVSGQQVKEGTYQPGVHFITSLPAGFYLVNGQKVIVKYPCPAFVILKRYLLSRRYRFCFPSQKTRSDTDTNFDNKTMITGTLPHHSCYNRKQV